MKTKAMADNKKKKSKKIEEAKDSDDMKDVETSCEEGKGSQDENEEPTNEEGDAGADSLIEDDGSWQEKYARLMADFQNFRKRTEKEKTDVYSFANEKIMTDLLEVVDNFERALDSECKDKAYREGMTMIFKRMMDILTDSGLEEIEAKGEDFDPNFHHAVMQDSNDEFGHGAVTEVLQKGYTLNGKVIRPAMVKVNE